jgi:hypothetical protein
LQAFWPLQALVALLHALWPLQALAPLHLMSAACAAVTKVVAANTATAVAKMDCLVMMRSLLWSAPEIDACPVYADAWKADDRSVLNLS